MMRPESAGLSPDPQQRPGAILPVLAETKAGGYFVSNYPPYSYWSGGETGKALAILETAPAPGRPLGVYLHIPFCRKRCHFCYFKVYTDKNAGEVERYIDTLDAELRLFSRKPAIAGRKPQFIYFGGGTPSYISSRQLTRLVESLKASLEWDAAEEITFECEPGTLTEGKLQTIRDLGVTRLSLGVENFDDGVLQANGRAHASREIDRAYDFARSAGFPQINIDLIAGMVRETDDNWRECVRRTVGMSPDSVTIYQMEVPYNTTIFRDMKSHGESVAPVADWKQKREWVAYAFSELERAGYTVGSAYTAVKNATGAGFLYRDSLWHGADMLGLGVASFSYVQGVHFQNDPDFHSYCARVEAGSIPLSRALIPADEERMIREFVLQMKLGHVERTYFEQKFGADILQRFAEPLERLRQAGLADTTPGGVTLTRDGLMQVDGLLPLFFLPQHRTDTTG